MDDENHLLDTTYVVGDEFNIHSRAKQASAVHQNQHAYSAIAISISYQGRRNHHLEGVQFYIAGLDFHLRNDQ